jgi:hypothetical protein
VGARVEQYFLDLTYTDPIMMADRVLIEDRIAVPDAAFDYAGYRIWVTSDTYPDRIRTTYLRGEVVEMSPESLEAHTKARIHSGALGSCRRASRRGTGA